VPASDEAQHFDFALAEASYGFMTDVVNTMARSSEDSPGGLAIESACTYLALQFLSGVLR
jgi:hypothetical protein